MALDYKDLFDKALKLPVAQKVLAVAGLNLAFIYLVYSAMISPKYAEAGVLRGELDSLAQQVIHNRMIVADIPRFEQEKVDLEKSLEKAIEQLPNEKDIDELLERIAEAGRTSGLKIKLFRPKREVPEGLYARVPVDMSVDGSYESLYAFFEKVSRFERIVNLGSLNLKTIGKEMLAADPKLESRFVVTTFMFIAEDEPLEPPADG